MNTQSIKHNIEIIANVGVLMGIILLAYEVSQNNELLAAESRTTHMLVRANNSIEQARDGELMALRVKAANGESLTQAEQLRLNQDSAHKFIVWEWEFEQYIDGHLTSLPIGAYRRVVVRDANALEFWPVWSDGANPDFVAFMEENVISQLE